MELQQPILGASDQSSFLRQPSRYAPPEGLENVRPYSVGTGRGVIGQRPGWRNLFGTSFGTGRIQALGVVSRGVTQVGLKPGVCRVVSAAGVSSTPDIEGQVWGLRKNFGLFSRFYLDVSGDGGSGSESVNACGINPAGTRLFVATNYDDGVETHDVARVTALDTDDLSQVWTTKLTNAMGNVGASQITATADYVFVCAARGLRVLNATTGAEIGAGTDWLNGWSSAAVASCVTLDGQFLWVAFRGSSAASAISVADGVGGSTVTVAAGDNQRFFRSGVMKFRINAAGSASPITQVSIPGLASTQKYYEAAHGYLRLSEKLPIAPRGVWPSCIAATAGGGFVLGHTNTGRGPSTPVAFPASGEGGYATVSAFDANGAFLWRADTDSLKELGTSGYYNDVGDASVQGIAVDADGAVYAAGRMTASGVNAFCLEPLLGLRIWSVRLGDSASTHRIRRHGVAVDPTDGHPIFAGDRAASGTWEGAPAGTPPANIWKRRPLDGGHARHFDLAASVTGLGVAASVGGDVFYVTDKV